jgi:hypothetical protein
MEMTTKKTPEKGQFTDKIKCAYYLKKETEEMIMLLLIHYMKLGSRLSKSNIIDEAVETLYGLEIGKK